MKHPDPRLRAYCDLVVAEPVSVTAVRDPATAWDVLVEDALTAVALVRELAPAEAVDVGSGGGSPGIPLALALGIPVTLLEATGTKCRFLERAVPPLGSALHGRPRPVGGVRPGGGPRPVPARARPRARAAAGRGRAACCRWSRREGRRSCGRAPGGSTTPLAATAALVGGAVEAVHEAAPAPASRRASEGRRDSRALSAPSGDRPCAPPCAVYLSRSTSARARPRVPVPSSSA